MASNENVPVREFCANGSCMNTKEVEAKLDEGNIQDAETALQEGLSLSSEVFIYSTFFSIPLLSQIYCIQM